MGILYGSNYTGPSIGSSRSSVSLATEGVGGEWGVLTDEEARSIGLPTSGFNVPGNPENLRTALPADVATIGGSLGSLGLTGGESSFGAQATEKLGLNTENAARQVQLSQDRLKQFETPKGEEFSQQDEFAKKEEEKRLAAKEATKANTITFVNPETGQEVVKRGASDSDIRSYAKLGFQVAEADTSEDIMLSSDPEVARLQQEAKQAENELRSMSQALMRFTISDKELRQQTRAIESQWNARINDMREVNDRREQSIKTLGVRLGSRWTGGRGGVFGGVIAAEERAGINRIADLEAQKQTAISNARIAADERNWNVYVEQSKVATATYNEKQKQLAEMQKAAEEKNKEVQAQKRTASVEAAIADLYGQGVTNPATILDALNFTEDGTMVGDVTFDEIEGALDVIERGKSTKDQTTNMIEYSFAQQQGFNGSFMQYIAAKAAAGRAPAQADPMGDLMDTLRLQLLQQQVEQGKEGKPPTANQLTLGSYASRIEQAEPTLHGLEETIAGMNPVSFEAQIFADHPALQSKEIEQYVQASRNYINAILRRESGAVISPTEFSEARKQYLPIPGDSEETLAQKRQNRQLNFETYKRGAGNAYMSMDELLGAAQVTQPTAQTDDYSAAQDAAVGSTVTIDGVAYKKTGDDSYEEI